MTKTSRQQTPLWRFVLVALLLACLLLLLAAKALSLQVLDTERGREFLKDQGDARTVRTEKIPAYRGVISDRNGEPLAISTPVASIWIEPRHLLGQRKKWQSLADAVGISVAQLEKKITDNQSRSFVYLRRHIAPSQAEHVVALKIQGVNLQREYKRYYPAGEVAAHLIGFTNIDDEGQEGVELAYDHYLRGESGSKKVLKDLRGNIFRDIGPGKSANPGKDLKLSIDMRLQHAAYRELKSAINKAGASAGSVVMIDSRTGEVLAMVNHPSFNPNNRSKLQPGNLRNRAVTDVLEPGSTVKPFTVVAAFESGRYGPASTIDTNPGHIRIGNKILHDPVNYQVVDMTKLLAKSSQVATSKLAMDLDENAVFEVFSRFGLGVSTGSGFPGESAGILPNRSVWRPIERVNFAFGYGLAVTPLQLAQAYSVLASGGVMRPARLLKQEAAEPGQRLVAPDIASHLVTMLEAVTNEGGTATRAQTAAYRVAGKTGTVHKVGKQGGYDEDRYMALFAGLAPASNPRIVTVVMIDEPDLKNYHGGVTAAPVFSRIVADAMRILDVSPDKSLSAESKVVSADAQTISLAGGRKSIR